jgi:hypothetical protein
MKKQTLPIQEIAGQVFPSRSCVQVLDDQVLEASAPSSTPFPLCTQPTENLLQPIAKASIMFLATTMRPSV